MERNMLQRELIIYLLVTYKQLLSVSFIVLLFANNVIVESTVDSG